MEIVEINDHTFVAVCNSGLWDPRRSRVLSWSSMVVGLK